MIKTSKKIICDQCSKETEIIENPDIETAFIKSKWLCFNFEQPPHEIYKDFCSVECVKDYIDDNYKPEKCTK